MKITSKILVCVLGAIFIFSSLGAAYAVDPTPVPTPEIIPDPLLEVVGDTAMYYIYQCMRAWGIEIDYNGSKEFNEQISGLLTQWVLEYLDTLPSAYTIAQWIAPWQSSFDYWGNYRFNDSALEDIQDFVDWLVTTLGANDNVTIPVIESQYKIGQMVVYKAPVEWYSYGGQNQQSNALHSDCVGRIRPSVDTNAYVFFASADGTETNTYVYVLTLVSSTVEVDTYFPAWNATNPYQITTNLEIIFMGYNIVNPQYYIAMVPYGAHGPHEVVGYSTYIYTPEQVALALSSDWSHSDVEVDVITGDILLPDDDPEYTPGDSIIIIDNHPEYQVIEWDGTVTVENLPAIVSTGSIPVPGDDLNPGLVNAWHPISTLIEMTADSMGMLIGIVYEFPEEVLIPIFAVLGGIIIFGIIHAMKEH